MSKSAYLSEVYNIAMLCILVTLISSCMGPNNNDSVTVRVMSFNIKFDDPNDGINEWSNRKDMVARVIRFHHADMIGIQEARIHQLQDLDEQLPEFNRIGLPRFDGGRHDEYCVIYYRTDRFELLDGDTFWLSDTPEIQGSMGWDAVLPRIVTWGQFQDNRNGKSFFLFNTHFDHRGVQARTESANLLLLKGKEIATDQPLVIMGDLNAVEDSEPYRILTDVDKGPVRYDLIDGFYHARYGHHGPEGTWTGFDRIHYDRRIDYIFVNPGFSVIHHGILADKQDGRFPSDHLPVLAEIEFSQD